LSPERRSRFIFKEYPAAFSRVRRQLDLIKSYLTLDRRGRICQCNRPNFRTSRNRAVCENRKRCVETLSTDKLQAHRLKHIIPYVSENLSAEAFYLSTFLPPPDGISRKAAYQIPCGSLTLSSAASGCLISPFAIFDRHPPAVVDCRTSPITAALIFIYRAPSSSAVGW
jgi:hypothetical protein